MNENNLKDKTIKGTFWSAADAFLGQGVTFIVGIVLARLLSPEEYGLIGIVTIFTTVMMGVVDSGFSNALIRKLYVTDEDYSTLFYVNFLMSIFMYVLLFIMAPFIASFFERPQLIKLSRVMGLLLIFQAFSIVQYTKLSRNVDFKTKTKSSFISAVISGGVGVVMAMIGFGVWALVAQVLSRQLLYSICLWIFNHWWPRMHFCLESFNYMWGFGWKLLLSGILNSIWNELYKMVIGKYYNPATLGQYTRSEQYASIFSSNLTSIVQRVSYPVLAQVQEDRTRMVSAYRKVIKITMFVTAVTMISIGAAAEPLIYCLIGPQWHDAAVYLPPICIILSMYPLHAINLNMLQVLNRTDIFLYIELIKKVILLGPLVLGIFVSIYWMLIGSIISGILIFFLNSYYSGTALGYSSWKQLNDVMPSYGMALVIASTIYFIKYLPISNWIILSIQLLVGIIVFIIINEIIRMPEYVEIKNIISRVIEKRVRKSK